jgi:hypothetical protein
MQEKIFMFQTFQSVFQVLQKSSYLFMCFHQVQRFVTYGVKHNVKLVEDFATVICIMSSKLAADAAGGKANTFVFGCGVYIYIYMPENLRKVHLYVYICTFLRFSGMFSTVMTLFKSYSDKCTQFMLFNTTLYY